MGAGVLILYNKGMLICFDLDGTLLNSSHQVSPNTAQAVKDLRANGHQVMLISSRPTRSVQMYAEGLGLADQMHVSLGGGYLYRGTEVLYNQTAPPLFCQKAAEAADWLDLHISAYAGWGWYANLRDRFLRTEENIVGFKADALRDLAAEPIAANKIVAIGEPEKTQPYANAMLEVSDLYSVNIAHPRFYELTPKNINKSSGLRQACLLLGIDPSEVVAFGDGDNDVEMLKFAGMGVAMGNALPVAKAAANKVTLHHDHGGIEFMLKELGLV